MKCRCKFRVQKLVRDKMAMIIVGSEGEAIVSQREMDDQEHTQRLA